jgi:hypothetical protein
VGTAATAALPMANADSNMTHTNTIAIFFISFFLRFGWLFISGSLSSFLLPRSF